MPRGWYSGPSPAGENSSDEDEGPSEPPYRASGFAAIMNNVRSDAEEDEDQHEGRVDWEFDMGAFSLASVRFPTSNSSKGTGRVIPSKFKPPSDSVKPLELFRGRRRFMSMTRIVLPDDPRSGLILTDGACLNNGQPNPKAGWAFVQGLFKGEPATVYRRLECMGPFGNEGIQSSNRAELRAVIAALRFREWTGEFFTTMTIATDSEYVVEGATKWVKNWIRRGWKTTGNAPVKNRDLWEALLGEVERWHDAGLAVRFWKIPREWNETADAAAKKAAAERAIPNQWHDARGTAFQ